LEVKGGKEFFIVDMVYNFRKEKQRKCIRGLQ
jgi:hypothetical protein